MLNTRSGIRNKILNYFFLNEENRVYINELARLLEADPKNIYRGLVRLEEEGILASEFKGNQRHFFCRKGDPLYKGYREIFLKTAGLEAILKNELKQVKGLEEAYLFGSYARKQYGPQSDIDLLLVGDHEPLAVQKVIFGVQKATGREINTVNMKPAELQKRKASGDQFIRSIFSHKVIRIL